MSERRGHHSFTIPKGATFGCFTALEELVVSYPLTSYGHNGITGITTRKTIWHDRTEVERTHPDGRVERDTIPSPSTHR